MISFSFLPSIKIIYQGLSNSSKGIGAVDETDPPLIKGLGFELWVYGKILCTEHFPPNGALPDANLN